ncbi:hypothetical protein VTL71DRAFT_7699 [Oculimacula yallundae]|uniref:LysM domain-containing protein n=1 Tax=Oculimacula yallundae TaxID=86028 RepID=A0ABR4BWC6_9HELO
MRTFATLVTLASCILPALGQAGTNCDIVKNVTVISGDTLGAIAISNSVKVSQILFVNPKITNANFINIGDVIAIPNSACDIGSMPVPPVAPITCDSTNRARTYTVVAGDTLFIIATQKFGVTLGALEAANPQIADPNLIQVGDVINIPACPVQITPSCFNGTQATYTVVSGDGLWVIATQKFGITLDSLLAANPQITNPDLILVGQVINIPLCGHITTPSTTAGSTPVVITKRVKARMVKKNRIGRAIVV